MISAALAVPVVPEVYCSKAVSESDRGTCVFSSGAECRTSSSGSVPGRGPPLLSRNGGGGGSVGVSGRKSRYSVSTTVSSFVCVRIGSTTKYASFVVTRTRAPESSNSWSSSTALCIGFRHTATPPARSVP